MKKVQLIRESSENNILTLLLAIKKKTQRVEICKLLTHRS